MMRITYVEIAGFNRFNVTGIKKLILKPNEIIQLILGTNGSGKSSLMNELTPLPPDQNNYQSKEGYKIIHLTHQNKRYVLTSRFGVNHPHSFEVDGEEHNDGGTITVQRELVKRHFGITPEIHSLMTGTELFTTMSASRRREWFTLLSEVSYDYALAVFTKLKEKHRDISGALKHAKKRLVQERARIISEEEIRKLSNEVKQIHAELSVLYQNRNASTRSEDAVLNSFETNQSKLKQLIVQIDKINFSQPNTGKMLLESELIRNEWGELIPVYFRNLEEIDLFINSAQADVGFKEKLIQERENSFREIQKKITLLEKTGEDGLRTLTEKIRCSKNKITNLKAKRIVGLENLYFKEALATLNTAAETLFEILTVLPDNGDRHLSSQRLKDLSDEVAALTKEIREKDALIEKYRLEINHLQKHKDAGLLVCPACSHKWNPKFNVSDLGNLETQLKNLIEKLEFLNEKKIKIDSELKENIEYGDLIRRYFYCVRATPSFNSFWNYVAENNWIYQSPKRILNLIDDVRHDLYLEEEVASEEAKIHEYKELATASAKLGDESLIELKAILKDTETDVERLTQSLARLRQNLLIAQKYKKNIQQADALQRQISDLLKEGNALHTEHIESIRHSFINLCIQEHQSNLAVKERIISSVNAQQALILDLENQIEVLNKEEEVAKHLVNELSPTSGLIAEGLLGFIRFFLKRMNGIVKKIWSYSMVVESCHVGDEGVELDYKFPVSVPNSTKPIKDVEFGSTGMKEVFDLSFKLCAMHFLGLDHIPLVLDEFGRTMDKAHKEQATRFIQNYVNQLSHTQLFMVSHDLLQYGSISNVDICVLCGTNIVVPDKCNQHVVIEY